MNGAALGGYLECWRFRSDLCSSSSCCAGWPKLVAYRERAGVKGLRLGQIEDSSLGPAGIRTLVSGQPGVAGGDGTVKPPAAAASDSSSSAVGSEPALNPSAIQEWWLCEPLP